MPKFMIVAGEASGDLHGAHLVHALKKRVPDAQFSGVGGDHLREAGMTLLSSSDELGVVGISEVVKKLGVVLKVFRRLARFLKTERPDLLILIDYPEFNFLLARVAHKAGIPIAYYISPQVWAWRSGRVNTIRRLVDKMIVIFPFEQDFYKQHGVDVEWVGHPMVDSVHASLNKEDFCRQYSLNPERPILGLLPGSRESEVSRLLPVMLGAAERIQAQQPEVQFVLPVASSLQQSSLFSELPAHIRPILRQPYNTIHAADLIVTASGTVTVETAILETPMIITYIVSPTTYFLGKRIIKVPFIGMVNLIAGDQVVLELIQDAVTPKRIADEVLNLLRSPEKLAAIRTELRRVHQKLGAPGAPDRAAAVIADMLKKSHETILEKS
jgi:lipid-A-disaccharide synthase